MLTLRVWTPANRNNWTFSHARDLVSITTRVLDFHAMQMIFPACARNTALLAGLR
jgi:hypothetical protein